jgi:hypothetical protein
MSWFAPCFSRSNKNDPRNQTKTNKLFSFVCFVDRFSEEIVNL